MYIREALNFNCPKCDAGIGEECISLTYGRRMARWVHHGRIPSKFPSGGYQETRLRKWLKANVRLLTGDE